LVRALQEVKEQASREPAAASKVDSVAVVAVDGAVKALQQRRPFRRRGGPTANLA